MVMSKNVWLDVPSNESKQLALVTDRAARYDEAARSWYVDPHTAVKYGQELQKWFRPVISIRPGEEVVPMTIRGVDHPCVSCKRPSLAVVQWEVPNDDIIATARRPLQLAAAALWSVDTEVVNRRGDWARFGDKFSKTQKETYFSNKCRFDDVLLGEVPLYQRYEASRARAGLVVTLGVISVPLRLVREVFDWYDAQ